MTVMIGKERDSVIPGYSRRLDGPESLYAFRPFFIRLANKNTYYSELSYVGMDVFV